MNYLFTVGEVSKILNISIDTLRYYDKIGLLSPRSRGSNKYRYYEISQLDTLITIKMLRAMEISVEKIHSILSESELNNIYTLISEKRLEVDNKRNYLELLVKKLDFLERSFKDFENVDCIEIVRRPKYWAFLTDSIMESSDSKLPENIESKIKDIAQYKEWIGLCHTVSIVSKENILNGNYHSYLHNGIISTFDFEVENSTFEVINSTQCIKKCIIIDLDNYSNLDNHYNQMKEYIKRRNLKITGDSLEINIYNQYQKHYIVIYIPVEDA